MHSYSFILGLKEWDVENIIDFIKPNYTMLAYNDISEAREDKLFCMG